MTKLKRIGMLLVTMVALSLFVSTTAALADGMVVQPIQGNYATTFSVQADGFSPQEPVRIAAWLLDGTGVGLPGATADEVGHIAFTVTPLSEWHDGLVTLAAKGTHSQRVYSATFHLVHDTVVNSSSWRGEYFNNTDLSGNPVLVRYDAAVNFDWGSGSPSDVVHADNFSARWTTTRTLADAGHYTLVATADDGVRVWVDDQLVIDAWYDQPATTYSANLYLGAGQHSLRVEYYEHLYDARVTVELSKA